MQNFRVLDVLLLKTFPSFLFPDLAVYIPQAKAWGFDGVC